MQLTLKRCWLPEMSIRLEWTPCWCLRTSSKHTYLSVALQIAGLIVAFPLWKFLDWYTGMCSAWMVNNFSVVSTIYYDKILSILTMQNMIAYLTVKVLLRLVCPKVVGILLFVALFRWHWIECVLWEARAPRSVSTRMFSFLELVGNYVHCSDTV